MSRRPSSLRHVLSAVTRRRVPHRAAGRLLTDNERAVIERLLDGEWPGAAAFRAQIAATEVVGECGCGCGTLDLRVDPNRAPRAEDLAWYTEDETYPVAENTGPSYLMLFQRGGWLRELEHLPGDGDPPQTINPRTIAPEDWEEDSEAPDA